MQVEKLPSRWIEILASLVADWRGLRQARNSIVVTREDDRLVMRRARDARGTIVATLAPGATLPAETAQAMRKQLVVFELAADKVVTRQLKVPAKAQEFLAGIVRNQIDRLSPWPPAQALFCLDARPAANDAGNLDVRVYIAARANIEALREELAASGLVPQRISVRAAAGGKSTLLPLWTRNADAAPKHLPRLVAAALAGMLVVSAAVSFWAFSSASASWAEFEEVSAHRQTLQRQSTTPRKLQDLATLAPPERAWALKEMMPAAVLVVETLSRALPDTAYLTELHLENTTLRMIGLAADAPALIGDLERSHRFSDVHFFAPTTKAQDGNLYRFYVEAHVASQPQFFGD